MVALARLPAAPFAGTLVLAWTDRGPAAQVGGGWKARHIVTWFGHDRDRADSIDTGNDVQGGERRLERDYAPIDFRRHACDGLLEEVDLCQDLFEEACMMRPKAPLQSTVQGGQLLSQYASR